MKKTNTVNMKREDAAKLIEEIRVALAEESGKDTPNAMVDALAKIRRAFSERDVPELVSCDGEAHMNPHNQDCDKCAPRWGFVGPVVVIK